MSSCDRVPRCRLVDAIHTRALIPRAILYSQYAGNDAFKAGKWTEAVEGYTRAIDLDPDNKVLLYCRTACTSDVDPEE